MYFSSNGKGCDEGNGEIETGGFYTVANDIIRRRGLISEAKFIKEDAASEMSSRRIRWPGGGYSLAREDMVSGAAPRARARC